MATSSAFGDLLQAFRASQDPFDIGKVFHTEVLPFDDDWDVEDIDERGLLSDSGDAKLAVGTEALLKQFEAECGISESTILQDPLPSLRHKENIMGLHFSLTQATKKKDPEESHLIVTFSCNCKRYDQIVERAHLYLRIREPSSAQITNWGLWYPPQDEISVEKSTEKQSAVQVMVQELHSNLGVSASASKTTQTKWTSKDAAYAEGNLDKDERGDTRLAVSMHGNLKNDKGLGGPWETGFKLDDKCLNQEVSVEYEMRVDFVRNNVGWRRILKTKKKNGKFPCHRFIYGMVPSVTSKSLKSRRISGSASSSASISSSSFASASESGMGDRRHLP